MICKVCKQPIRINSKGFPECSCTLEKSISFELVSLGENITYKLLKCNFPVKQMYFTPREVQLLLDSGIRVKIEKSSRLKL